MAAPQRSTAPVGTVRHAPRALPRRDARGRFVRPEPSMPRNGSAPRVLFVTSEMADFLKAGGLGDVAAALPRALRGYCEPRVLIPGYPAVLRLLGPLRRVGTVHGRAGLPDCALGLGALPDGLRVLVLLHPQLFEREGSPYVDGQGQDWADNPVRFAALAHAAAEIAAGHAGLDWRPQLLHLNDWPSALAAGYVRWRGVPAACLLTVHNLAYQGLVPLALAPVLDVPQSALGAIDFHGRLSFLQAGIVHADHVNTVSGSYARQITGPAQGCGMDRLLAGLAARGGLSGILNGIDASWDPRTDPHLHAHFDIGQWQGRRANARQVRREFGLPDCTGPLFAVVSRLVHQKGIDLVCEVAPQIVAAGGQVVVIGNGEPQLEQAVQRLAQRFPGRVGVRVGFEERLARRMFAGADFLLMPSRFEPCGLSQMYAQRYGCLPIVHATGGLADTIENGITGLQMHEPTADALRRGVQRAFRVYRLPHLFEAMRRAAMHAPDGWDGAARRYAARYGQMLREGEARIAEAA